MKKLQRTDIFAILLAILMVFTAPFASDAPAAAWWGTAFSVICGNAVGQNAAGDTQEVVFRFKLAELWER